VRGPRPLGLIGRIVAILVIVLAIGFIANTLVYKRAGDFALLEDEAQRMADHLAVAAQVLDHAPAADRTRLASELSTDHFAIAWAVHADRPEGSLDLSGLTGQILALAPDLARRGLAMHLSPLRDGGAIAGSLALEDGSVLSFNAVWGEGIWSLTFSRVVGLLIPTLALALLGGLLMRTTLKPLARLMAAAAKVDGGTPDPVTPQGAAEIRALIGTFNEMQVRIHRLVEGRTQALAAVGHDLRTPLARLRLRLDTAALDDEARLGMVRDIDEVDGLLGSLQAYLGGQGGQVRPERVDLAAMASTLVDNAADLGAAARYQGPDSLSATFRPVAVRRALANLLDNAVQYGGSARLDLRRIGEEVVLTVEDDGPGIPEESLAEVVQPFVRLDAARARNTAGMGLGLAIVQDAIQAEGGVFTLENRREGGLRATVRLPAG
jgi:signal transduction histidine kinase